MKKLMVFCSLFFWSVSIYGQESITDSTDICTSDWTIITDATIDYPNPNIVELVGLYEKYETQCFDDSTKKCFNYYVSYSFFGTDTGGNYKTPCTKFDMDLGIDGGYKGTGEEWIHVKPDFIGFMQYLKYKFIK